MHDDNGCDIIGDFYILSMNRRYFDKLMFDSIICYGFNNKNLRKQYEEIGIVNNDFDFIMTADKNRQNKILILIKKQ